MGPDRPSGLVVEELWRYPVKSMGGERVAQAAVDALGLQGDRRWGLVDPSTGRLLSARREPALLLAEARHLGPGQVAITLPDGTETTSDEDLSRWLGRPVALVPAAGGGRTVDVPDAEERSWGTFAAAEGAWHDSARTRLSLVSRRTVGDWEPRRFRSNVLLAGGGEDALVDHVLRVGTAELRVTKRVSRCVMVNRPLPGLSADPSVLRTILGTREGTLAVGALVTEPGTIAEGDVVEVVAPA